LEAGTSFRSQSILGERSGEVMTIVQVVMLGCVPFTVLRDAIIAHPTVAQSLKMYFGAMNSLENG
jgi:hypothetical protein